MVRCQGVKSHIRRKSPRLANAHSSSPVICITGAYESATIGNNHSGLIAELLRRIDARRAAMSLAVALALEFEAICTLADHRLASGLSASDAVIYVDGLIGLAEPVRSRPANSSCTEGFNSHWCSRTGKPIPDCLTFSRVDAFFCSDPSGPSSVSYHLPTSHSFSGRTLHWQ